ncbi:ABC transporter ATP-binding protein [Emcibacter sp. SYSU 3D8]|uniref:ABC transporter ATP-binding protein n=1 Tax=Emcibacter sp. SYSU 3D8 TaxID=3133969 RepID=UPI0031FE466F
MAVGSGGLQDKPWTDPTAEPFIRIEGVSKHFGDVAAVNGVDLNIYRGEFFALLGASGCGKTTLLRMLAGFETPSAGRIFIDGVDMAGIPPYRRPVNMMFQSYALFPHMTVGQNVAFGLQQDGVARAEIAGRVAEMLDLVQIRALEKRKPDQLSGGQRQRVALARALVKRPKLVLLDEPLGALDRKLREQTQFELVNIQEELGMTFVIVTHDQEEAMTMASRVCVMNAGMVEQVGAPAEVYEYPNSRFVADFIGAANLFDGVVIEASPTQTRVASPDLGADIVVGTGGTAAVGASVSVMVRPEKIQVIADGSPAAGFNWAEGIVREIAYLGDVSVYHVELPSGKRIQFTRANLLHTTDNPLTWDDKVRFQWHPANGILLVI